MLINVMIATVAAHLAAALKLPDHLASIVSGGIGRIIRKYMRNEDSDLITIRNYLRMLFHDLGFVSKLDHAGGLLFPTARQSRPADRP